MVNNVALAPEFAPWRQAAQQRGYRVVIGLPLIVETKTVGVITLYGDQPNAFTPEEVQLLSEMTNDLAYGVMALRTRRALHEREQQYRTIVETAQEGIWVIDRQYHTTYINQRMTELLGYVNNEVLGRSVFDFVDPGLHADLEQHLIAYQRGEKAVFEFCLNAKTGALWVIVSAAPILDAQGRYTGSFAMLTDITERHKAEESQREFARKTIEAATEGKLLIRDREEIEAMAGPPMMSHEIRDVADLEGIRHAVEEIAHTTGMDEERIDDFILCISEAATNALKHANGGIFTLHKLDETLLAVVTDHGPGIAAINLPEVALKRGYTTGVSLGMGYKAMISIADTVYLATGPDGTTVAIAMAPHAPAPPPIALPGLAEEW